MITKEQLISIDGLTQDNISYYFGGWEYEYNIKSQELWFINDGFGEPEFLCQITDFDKLKELLDILPQW